MLIKNEKMRPICEINPSTLTRRNTMLQGIFWTLRKPFPGIVNHGEGAERETGRKTRVSKVDQGSFDRRSERVKLGELTHDRRTHRKSCARLQEVLSLDRLGIAGTTIIMVQRIVRQTRYRQPETREAFFLAVRVSYRSPI